MHGSVAVGRVRTSSVGRRSTVLSEAAARRPSADLSSAVRWDEWTQQHHGGAKDAVLATSRASAANGIPGTSRSFAAAGVVVASARGRSKPPTPPEVQRGSTPDQSLPMSTASVPSSYVASSAGNLVATPRRRVDHQPTIESRVQGLRTEQLRHNARARLDSRSSASQTRIEAVRSGLGSRSVNAPLEAAVARSRAGSASHVPATSSRSSEEGRTERDARRARRERRHAEMQDAMLAAAISISLADEEEQRQLDAAMAMSRGAIEVGLATSSPQVFDGADEETMLAQAQRESLLHAWRESLPISSYNPDRRDSTAAGSQTEDVAECSLCLAEFERADRVMHLDCLHCFHVDCISPWIAKQSTCPLCKVDFLANLL